MQDFTVYINIEDQPAYTWEGIAEDREQARARAFRIAEQKGRILDYDIEDGEEYETISEAEAEDRYIEMLNDCYGSVDVAGYTYETSEALRSLDPIAYRCGLSDFISSLEEDRILLEGY